MKYFAWVMWALLTAIGVIIMGLVWWPYTPLRIDCLKADRETVCRGSELCFIISGEKFYEMPAEVIVEMVNSERYAVMAYTSNRPKGNVFRKRCFLVPYNVKPGSYQVIWSGTYVMNAFNAVHLKARSDIIRVVK